MSTPSSVIFTHLTNVLLKVSKSKEIDNGSLQEALIKICYAACQGLKINRASIWLMNPERSYIKNQVTCTNDHKILQEDFILKEEVYPTYFKALLEERSIVAHDALTSPILIEFKENYLIPLNITSLLDSPVRLRGQIVGILCCEHTGQSKHWLQEEQSFAATLAELVSRALIANERSKLEEKLRSLHSKD